VIYVVTGDYTSVKFYWGLIVDQSLTSVGEMHFIANWRRKSRVRVHLRWWNRT